MCVDCADTMLQRLCDDQPEDVVGQLGAVETQLWREQVRHVRGAGDTVIEPPHQILDDSGKNINVDVSMGDVKESASSSVAVIARP